MSTCRVHVCARVMFSVKWGGALNLSCLLDQENRSEWQSGSHAAPATGKRLLRLYRRQRPEDKFSMCLAAQCHVSWMVRFSLKCFKVFATGVALGTVVMKKTATTDASLTGRRVVFKVSEWNLALDTLSCS